MYVCLTLYVVYCPDRNCKRGEPREIPASLPIQISLPITTNVMKLDKLVYHLLPSIFIIVQPHLQTTFLKDQLLVVHSHTQRVNYL